MLFTYRKSGYAALGTYAFVVRLNDSTTDRKIRDWVVSNLPAMDIVVFAIDGTRAINTKSEMDTLRLIVESIAKASAYKKISLLVVFNKMDEGG